MADLVPRGGPECTLTSLPIETTIAKRKGHYSQIPMFQEWLPYLGQIFLLWGSFEQKSTTLLETMILGTDYAPDRRWKKLRGEKRQRFFLEQVDRTFPKGSGINKYLHELISDSITVQQKRNVMLHGTVHLVLGPDPHMVAEGTTKDGLPECHELREADIKLLFYEMSHLVGRFITLLPPFREAAQLSSDDISMLRELWSKAHPPTSEPHQP